MKKTLILSAAMLAMFFTACTKEQQSEEPQAAPTYKVATDQATEYLDLYYGLNKKVDFFVSSANGSVDGNNLTVTVKADESKVAEFNAGLTGSTALMLPAEAYSFESTQVTVYKNNKKSLSTSVTVSMLFSMPDTLFVLPISIASIEGSSAAKAAEKSTLFLVFKKNYQKVDKGNGTKEKPYLIYDAKDFWRIPDQVKAEAEAEGGCTYFKMMEDVDLGMKPIGTTPADTLNWPPFNAASPYDKKVDFNGNGHKVSNLVSQDQKYASFMGVVYGTIHDVTFVNPYIKGSAAIGTIGGYCGTNSADIRGELKNVHVVNGTVNSDHSANGTGGLVGRLFGKIDACSFNGTINDGKYAGGIAGFDDGKVKDATKRTDIEYLKSRASQITNCEVTGVINIPNGGQRIGGILGDVCCDYTEIRNCYVSAGICGNMCAGGIAGHANWDAGSEQHPYNTFSKCIVWCDSLTARNGGVANYSIGAIVGFCAVDNTCEDCWRKPDLQPICQNDAATAMFQFIDQPNSGAGNPQTVGVECDFKTIYKLPYNGKAAAAGKTPSAIAKELGWDQTIWDLSGDYPTLKSIKK